MLARLTAATREGEGDVAEADVTLDQVSERLNGAMERLLADELARVRLTVMRVMGQLQDEMSPAEFARLCGLVFRGADTVVRLVRARQAVAGSDRGGRELEQAFGDALNGLSERLDLDL
jgi:alpha-D-ribose 1-methylphosphonate 5-triphosphate synthase subunit PhnI